MASAEYWKVEVLNEGQAQTWETSSASIFKCPEHIREASKSCYNPKVLTLGPYATQDDLKYVSALNSQKINVAIATLTEKGVPSENRMRELVTHLGGDPDDLKKFGSEPKMDRADVHRILAVDSLFVAGILVNIVLKHGVSSQDYPPFVNTDSELWQGRLKSFPGFGENEPAYRALHQNFDAICRDLFLLENQIPIVFIEKALKYAIPELAHETCAEELLSFSIRVLIGVLGFIVKTQHYSVGDNVYNAENIKLSDCEHMLHFYYRVATGIFTDQMSVNQLGNAELGALDAKLPSITELWKFGLKLKSEPGPISFAHFDNAARTIFLPEIIVDNNTETLLRNLLAFEFLTRKPPVVSSYILLMVHLIETVSDVHIMRKHLVFEGFLGEDEPIRKMWNRFAQGDLEILKTRTDEIQTILKARNRIRKQLVDTYRQAFKSLYVILALIAAAFLLVCAFLQTLYTVLGFYKRH